MYRVLLSTFVLCINLVLIRDGWCNLLKLGPVLRQQPHNSTTNLPKALADLEMQKKYSPNYGYEPYWDIRLKPTTTALALKGKYDTTTKSYIACGEPCSYNYIRMGKICARNVSSLYYEGCKPVFLKVWCNGDTHGHLTGGYRTYANYCEFLDAQCNAGQQERLLFVHAGACRHQNDYFVPRYYADTMKKIKTASYLKNGRDLMKHWLQDYS